MKMIYNDMDKLLYSLPDYVWVKNEQCKYQFLNKKVLDTFFKKDYGQVFDRTDQELNNYFDTNNVSVFTSLCTDCKTIDVKKGSHKKSLRIEGIDTENGRVLLALSIITSSIYDGEEFRGVVCIGRDITLSVKQHSDLERLYMTKEFDKFEKLFQEHKYVFIEDNAYDA